VAEFSAADLGCLAPAAEYFEASIPAARDFEILALLRRAEAGDRLGSLIDVVRPDQESAVLRCFAERMASLAVGRREPDLLRVGLVAIGIANTRTNDPRDEMTVLGPLWHSTRRLGLDAAAEFKAAAAAVPSAARFFADWVARPPRLQTLSAMCYTEDGEGDGFRYVSDHRPIVFGDIGMGSGPLAKLLILHARIRHPVPPNPRLDPFRGRIARLHPVGGDADGAVGDATGDADSAAVGDLGDGKASYLLVTELDCWRAGGTWPRPRLVNGRKVLHWTLVEPAGAGDRRESDGLEESVDEMIDELTSGRVRLNGRCYAVEWLADPAAARIRKQHFRRRPRPFG
jgi:hypothetical protein